MKNKTTQTGFTIVELLIVIVVIGILAAITIVAFNGVQSRANDSAVQSDLRNFGNRVMRHHAENGVYPSNTDAPLASLGVKLNRSAYDTSENNVLYCGNVNNSNVGIAARSVSGAIFVFAGGSVSRYSGATALSNHAAFCTEIAQSNAARYVYIASTPEWRW